MRSRKTASARRPRRRSAAAAARAQAGSGRRRRCVFSPARPLRARRGGLRRRGGRACLVVGARLLLQQVLPAGVGAAVDALAGRHGNLAHPLPHPGAKHQGDHRRERDEDVREVHHGCHAIERPAGAAAAAARREARAGVKSQVSGAPLRTRRRPAPRAAHANRCAARRRVRPARAASADRGARLSLGRWVPPGARAALRRARRAAGPAERRTRF